MLFHLCVACAVAIDDLVVPVLTDLLFVLFMRCLIGVWFCCVLCLCLMIVCLACLF